MNTGSLSSSARVLVFLTSFLAWMGAGMQISLFPLISRTALLDLFSYIADKEEKEKQVALWFSWYVCAFLFGAALGGWVFGSAGDRLGRKRALGWSVLLYSLATGALWFLNDPLQIAIVRFVGCMGVGGAWPNAIALASEALPRVSKPWLAGWLGAAANFGFVLLGLIAWKFPVTSDSWRWILLVAASPFFLGLLILFFVPESPAWLDCKGLNSNAGAEKVSVWRSPLLNLTLLGIALGAVPTVGTAVSASWLIPWADQVAEKKSAKEQKAADPSIKAWTQVTRSTGAIVGSLLGGWLASLIGRRTTYFFISLLSLAISEAIFIFLEPGHPWFGTFVFLMGITGVTYFGWLPLYLPELFPTSARALGIGVSFNFGRIVAGFFALGSTVMVGWFGGDYARIGQATSLIFAVGMVIIFFAPDTSKAGAKA